VQKAFFKTKIVILFTFPSSCLWSVCGKCLLSDDLARVFGNNHKPVLFADDASVIVAHRNHTDVSQEITSAFNQLNKWFAANLLSSNLKKKKLNV
jgi:hypothetical protein